MEPQYRFCTSADGTEIAYSTLGAGRRTPMVNVESWAMEKERGHHKALGAKVEAAARMTVERSDGL